MARLFAVCCAVTAVCTVALRTAHRTSAASLATRAQALAAAAQAPPPSAPFNCSRWPTLCQAPFDCQTWTPEEKTQYSIRGLASEGHSNPRSWCMSPQYHEYAVECLVKKDLVKAAHLQYKWSIDSHDGIEELDGSYCFIEGHCSNLAVTNATTLEEADAMCDERYNHDDWTKMLSISKMHLMPNLVDAQGASKTTGFHNPKLTQFYLMMACAMGNYHCDVMYCKETYCKMPYYVQKYGHLLPKAPGHLIQQKMRV
eukprot:CAMPEP_0171058920 /NCGR_PEP_ID=MMETSP0766_2-20121228/2837_1 /TAXON_ID=439317 /ORGANISM="Gambierdiscus australes, Strain CAWD 149" /LENGTH=255 /DNA_ID=CAMNT_0011514279 /DNA_START=35 /DNA_END=802 /DNA_ORIENTATION=-